MSLEVAERGYDFARQSQESLTVRVDHVCSIVQYSVSPKFIIEVLAAIIETARPRQCTICTHRRNSAAELGQPTDSDLRPRHLGRATWQAALAGLSPSPGPCHRWLSGYATLPLLPPFVPYMSTIAARQTHKMTSGLYSDSSG